MSQGHTKLKNKESNSPLSSPTHRLLRKGKKRAGGQTLVA